MRPNMDVRRVPASAATLALGFALGTLSSTSPARAAEDLPSPQVPLPGALQAPLAQHHATHTSFKLYRRSLNVLGGHTAEVSGLLRPDLNARTVAMQIARGGRWITVARTKTGTRGRFTLHYRPSRVSSERVRVRFGGDANDTASHRSLGHLNVYRLAMASWYGGGGNLACGGVLTSSTLGVANKTLPCGTLVTLRYHGHMIRVPVIDRGPYVAGREFDLTEATKRALDFDGLGEVWSTS